MKAYGGKNLKRCRSKNEKKGKWSRLLLANYYRAFKKKPRQQAKKEISNELE